MNTPVVSAVGHETDFTIADFVADLRAPTPSAAAELITPELNKLKEDLYNKFIQLNRYYHYILESQNKNLEYIKKDLNYYNPVNQILDKYQILDNLFRNLIMLMETNIEKNKNKIENLYSKIDYLNPSSSLERGYTIVLDENGKLVPSLKELSVDDTLNLIFKDGMVNIKVVKINKGEFYDGRE